MSDVSTPLGFDSFKLNKQLLSAIQELGYTSPTPIQEKAIPLISAGHDLIGIAQTGTGKTAAYLLPILMKTKYAQGNHPRVLILAPTRELVIQIDQNIGELAKYTDLRHLAVYGGVGMKPQMEAIAKGIDILVATPGRLMDIYNKEGVWLRQINTMVLDEADRVMDMGFMPQITQILEIIPQKKRQNLLFSATMSPKVLKIADDFLEFPEKIEITPQATTAETIEQFIYHVPNMRTKINLLMYLLKDSENFKKIMVFSRKRTTANHVYKFLERKYAAGAKVIHANKDQNTRINAIREFRDGDVKVLVATDVAARGLDISMVSHVINFDMPVLYEDYVHRVGRTGRAYQDGIAITFCNPAEEYHIAKVEKLIRKKIKILPIPQEVEVVETPFEEKQTILRELDFIRQKEDPTYKGAFHEKKRPFRKDKKLTVKKGSKTSTAKRTKKK